MSPGTLHTSTRRTEFPTLKNGFKPMRNGIALLLLAAYMSFAGTTAHAAVGRTSGQFTVSQTGSAQYSIPIWAPPGPRGMKPNISLFYDSRASIGPLGLGWSIAGLGQITR